jgi:nucleotide-binding universal stress UspA family protein
VKHILIPTDFSPAADNALAYATELAKTFSAELSLIHIYMIPVEPEMTGALDRIVLDNAELLMKERTELLSKSGITVHTEVLPGSAIGGIRQYLHDHPVDFIVMGCQGEQAIPARFIGSTTTALIDLVEVPVLAVPAHFPPAVPRKIVWTTDRNPPAKKEALAPLFELLDRAKTTLSIFHLEEENDRLPPDPGFANLLGKVDYDFWHQAHDGEALEDAINDFVKTMDADLLVVLHRRQGWFNRLFKVSTSRREVWSSSVPVLVLRYQ